MKHYTSIEQSKKLLELGLSPESADWHYHYDFDFDELETCPTFTEEDDHYVLFPQDIPCWSVGELLQVMPIITDNEWYNDYPRLERYNDNTWGVESPVFNTKWYDNSIDACFEMVCYLLENGYIKKGE